MPHCIVEHSNDLKGQITAELIQKINDATLASNSSSRLVFLL